MSFGSQRHPSTIPQFPRQPACTLQFSSSSPGKDSGSHPSVSVNNQQHAAFSLHISNHHNRSPDNTYFYQMGNSRKAACLAFWEKCHMNATVWAKTGSFIEGSKKFSTSQCQHCTCSCHAQQGGCVFEYAGYWGAGRHPSLKEALPFSMFTCPKHFQNHCDGFGEARNTFIGPFSGWGNTVPLPSVAQAESRQSIWHPCQVSSVLMKV